MFNLFLYNREPQTGTFVMAQAQPEKYPAQGMPERFQRQLTWDTKIKANAIECFQYTTGKIFTGLQPTTFAGWFTGDLLVFRKNKSTKHLLIIYLPPDNSKALIALYRNFWKPSLPLRTDFAHREILNIWRKYKDWEGLKQNSR